MPITLGDTTITGLGVGGLPSGTVNATSLAAGAARANFGAGAVLQVIQATNNTTYTISGSGNFTGLEITITPASTSSRFLLICGLGQISQNSGGSTMAFNFSRNGTSLNFINLGTHNGVAAFVDNNSNLAPIMPFFSQIDSPATTSAITYRVTYNGDGGKAVGKRGDSFISASQQFQVLEIA